MPTRFISEWPAGVYAGDSRPQPDPIPNKGIPIGVLVMDDITLRMKRGMETYGTYLQAHNGRNALQDLYEELLDACCYIKQALIEQQ